MIIHLAPQTIALVKMSDANWPLCLKTSLYSTCSKINLTTLQLDLWDLNTAVLIEFLSSGSLQCFFMLRNVHDKGNLRQRVW